LETHDLAVAHYRYPHSALNIDRHPVWPSLGQRRKDEAVFDTAIGGHVVCPYRCSGRIIMTQQSGVRAEAHPVGDLDPFPQLGGRAGWVDAEQVSGNRLVGAERVELCGADKHAALRVYREIVEPPQP